MISKWVLKAIVQKSISFLPYRNRINHWFQKHVTKGLLLNDEHFGYKIKHAKDHIDYLIKYKGSTQQDCLELGTGWYPIIPIALHLCGVNKVSSVDISSHLSKKTIADTLKKYIEWDKKKGIAEMLPHHLEKRWEELLSINNKIEDYSLSQILKIIGLNTIVGDARNLSVQDNSFDFICSNNTFEHIYPQFLRSILVEFRRVLKPNGIMSHFVDMSDHFAHFDKSINIYNFLRFSDRQWQLIDNSIQPQNRLRWSDYKQMYNELGIPIEEEKVRPGNIAEVESLNIDAKYKAYSLEELAISHGYLVG